MVEVIGLKVKFPGEAAAGSKKSYLRSCVVRLEGLSLPSAERLVC